MTNTPRSLLSAALSLLALILLALGPAKAATERGVVYVVDASNSMWAQIDGENKIVTIRDAITRAFESQAGNLRLGVIAFGSQEANSCTDIRTVVPFATRDPAVARDGLGAVRPKGATPIAKAVEEAARVAGFTTRPATIVLIADGADNCSGDPCAVARALNEQSAQLRIDVIGYDSEAEKLAPLACMAEATGGTFTAADSVGELNDAITALTLAAVETAPDSGPPPVKPDEIATGVPSPRPTIALPPMRLPGAASPDQPAGEPASGEDAVRAAGAAVGLGDKAARAVTAARIPLRAMALITEDTAPIQSGLVWRVFDGQPDGGGEYKMVEESSDPQPVFILPKGDYVLNCAFGLATASRRVSVADQAVEEVMVLNAGGIRLKAIGGDELPLDGKAVTFTVYSSEQDEYGQRKLVVANAEPDTIIRLGAGAYHVVSQYGDANATIRTDLQVKPGKVTEATIRHDAAAITLKLVNEAGGEALANTAWSVLSPGGDVIKESYGAFPTHVLAAGEYTVVARHEGRLYNKGFSVEPGRPREVELVAQ
ncbi:MAG: VWA domain-containing protein [Flavobacteriaceae bacterium]